MRVERDIDSHHASHRSCCSDCRLGWVRGNSNGRMQIIDSNWIVVSQEPAPGTPFGEGEANLGAVKYGEPNSC